jgi:hypothetical protein
MQQLIGLLEWCTCEPAFGVPKFRSFRLRSFAINCWSIEITNRDGSILTSREVKTNVLLIVSWGMVIRIYRIFCWISQFYTRIAWDWSQSKHSGWC